MKATKIVMALAVIVGVAALFFNRGGGADHILITDATASPMANRDVMITLKIENRGAPDRLIGVTSTEAMAHFHQRDAKSGAPVPADDDVELTSEAAHIILSSLDGGAEPGRLIPITLTFEHAGPISLKAKMKAPDTAQMSHGSMSHSAMPHSEGHTPSSNSLNPTVAISASPVDDEWRIAVQSENFIFSQEAADGPHEAGVGHGHLYIGGVKIGRVYGEDAFIGSLPKGEHQVRLTLNTNDHRTYFVNDKPVTAITTIVVD